jgi:hypothetical protein
MAAITITDLPMDRGLDRKAMSAIRGAQSWVNGAFQVFTPPAVSVAPFVNFYQQITNTFYYVEEMVNNNQIVSIQSSGTNSPTTAVLISSINNGGPRLQV